MQVLKCTQQEFEALRAYFDSIEDGRTVGYFSQDNRLILKDVDGNYITNADKMLRLFWQDATPEQKTDFNATLAPLFDKIVDFSKVVLPQEAV